jgi:hypothetical protein
MTELEEVFQAFKLDYGLECCTVCMQLTSMKDAIGFPWCEDHAHHGQVMSWGYRHGYPELHFDRRALGPGEHCWWSTVVASAANSVNKGNEDFMWATLIYIEHLDSLEQAS